jgi:hypothetical protein
MRSSISTTFAQPQRILAEQEDRVLDHSGAGDTSLALRQGLHVVQPAQEQQVRDLLDHLLRIADAA